MSIADQLVSIKSKLPETVTLVAVSKTKPNADILAAYTAGQRVFGENKVQELVKKQEEFKNLKTVFNSIKNDTITILSMGMSGDYPLAIEQGSTMVRVGSAIFGHRN